MPQEPPQTLLERAGATAAGLGSLGEGRPHVAARDRDRRRRCSSWCSWSPSSRPSGGACRTTTGSSARPGCSSRPSASRLFYAIQCEAWRAILASLGEHLDARTARAIWGKSLVARYVPTNALMVVGRVVMAERHGVSKRGCLASIVYEIGLAVVTAVIVGAYFVITLPRLEDQPARYAILVVVPIALIALHPRVFQPLADFALRKLGRASLPATLPFGRVLELALVYLVSWVAMGDRRRGLRRRAASARRRRTSRTRPPRIRSPSARRSLPFVVPGGLGHARRRARDLAGGGPARCRGHGDRGRLPNLSDC